MTRIAFLGLGAMGSRMARHLVDADELDVVVYNRSPERAAALRDAGASWAETPRQAAEGADLVISIVSDDKAAADIWVDADRGALFGLRKGALAIESSTVTPGWIQRLAELTSARSARLLDAPVVGSTPQAEAGQLAFLMGGSADDVAEATPVLQRMGAKLVHAGPQTHGAILKLIVNSMLGVQVAMMAELLRMATAQGLDAADVLEKLSGMPVTSPVASVMAGLMVRNDHAPRFPVDLVAKDLRYARKLGDLPVVAAAQARFEAASAAGHGADNLTVVHRPDRGS